MDDSSKDRNEEKSDNPETTEKPVLEETQQNETVTQETTEESKTEEPGQEPKVDQSGAPDVDEEGDKSADQTELPQESGDQPDQSQEPEQPADQSDPPQESEDNPVDQSEDTQDKPEDSNEIVDQPVDQLEKENESGDPPVDQPEAINESGDQPVDQSEIQQSADTAGEPPQPTETTTSTEETEPTGQSEDTKEEKPTEQQTLSSEEVPVEKSTEEDSEKKEGEVEIPLTEAAEENVEGEEKAEDKEKKDDDDDEEDEGVTKPVDGQAATTRGDEDEIMSQEVKGDEEEEMIPDTFYYNVEDHVSKADITDESGLPQELLSLNHSFGYDCTKRANLHLLDDGIIMFVAGNLIEIINLQTKEQTYLRSTSGGGVGALAVHPSRKYFAVGEKGNGPNINIYEWPSLKLFRILRGGTEESYSYMDFSPDGKILASVGGDPDYMQTLWNWKNEKIMLRSKAFSQDVFRVSFSTELEGQLTSAGTGHIRFWKMAATFTGLKLQGQLGKFGKTEISDIEGYVELPDGKVLSGSEWGNMVLWDGGLIKVQICRKGRKPCHQGSIMQIVMDEGELMTVGADGCIRVWDFESIDTADVTDDTGIFEMEPMNEMKVGQGHNVSLQSITKSVNEEEPTIWFAQDVNGGVWKLDLSFSHTSLAPEKLLSYHAGPIESCDTSPVTNLVATTGLDRTVRIYDYKTKLSVCETRYNLGGTNLLWAPRTVDAKGATVIVGFEDGVVRVLNVAKIEDVDKQRKTKGDTELLLAQVFKPHSKPVTCMAIDNKGESLATASKDSTVFLFQIKDRDTYEPIGYVETPSAVTYLTWSPGSYAKTTLLVCCEGGQVMEIELPEEGKFDTSKTYHITGLTIRRYQFKSVKSRLRHEEELERKRLEELEIQKKKEEERRRRRERGEEEAEEEEEEKEPEPEWHPYIPEEPSPILYAQYSSPDTFWLSMDDFDAGYLYECKFVPDEEKSRLSEDQRDEPLQSVSVLNSRDVPMTCALFTDNKKQVIMGMKNGAIRIQPIENSDLGKIGPYWSLNMHDNYYGHVTHMALSYDGAYLFTVGADGNFFTYNYMSQEVLDEKVAEAKAKIPSARTDLDVRKIDDIDDPKAYSIEDAKQKAEYDKMMKLADEKKTSVRRTVVKMRRDFKKLLNKNEELPQHLMLARSEFEMDPRIKMELEQQKKEKIDLVKRELAWETEKHRIALDKLQQKFKMVVECERIVVKSFQTEHEVSSYRASKLSDDFYTMKALMTSRQSSMAGGKEGSREHTSDMKKLGRQDAESGTMVQDEAVENKIYTSLKGSQGERIRKALNKVEEKKKARAERRAQWNELHKSKPDEDYEDPADVASIKEAKENMGDYKLKTADDYVVPDHLRMNVEKARSRLLVIKDLLHTHKYNFNQRLLALRDKKIETIGNISKMVGDLHKVQEKLEDDQKRTIPKVPRMHPSEVPEKKFQFTRETLLKFKEEMSAKKIAAITGKGGDEFGGGFGGGGAKPTDPVHKTGSPVGRRGTPTSSGGDDNGMEDEVIVTQLEMQIKQAEEIRLLYEQDYILKKIEEIVKNFDAELRLLRHEKFRSAIELKNADLRHVTLFEELVLLKDFEKSENILADKVETKVNERLDIQDKMADVKQKSETKRKDIDKLIEKEKGLYTTFTASLGDNNKFTEYLTKVFKKKIKRAKKKDRDEAGSDDDSEEESDDESDFDDDEDEESEVGGFDLDVCPPGCDQTIYDNTCALREKRLDIEEALVEEKKAAEGLKKELENMQKKEKTIASALKNAEDALEAFQVEKQKKINELDVVVTLKLNQIQFMTINGVLPQDLSPSLVFEWNGVTHLNRRIKELEHEKTLQKKQQKEAKKKCVQLIKDSKLFKDKIGKMEEQSNQMMIDKFGRIVDLEKLETVTINRNIEELKEKLRLNEIKCSNEIKQWEEKIGRRKENITDLTRMNTERLEQLNMLQSEKKELQTSLDSRQKSLGGEFSGARKTDVHERRRLIQLVQLQAQEVEALKEEITLLSRKGGHILPPAQPPIQQTPQRGVQNM